METREELKLTVDELADIVCEDNENFKNIEHEITGNWRHGTEEKLIVQRISDGKFFELNYRDSVKDECEFADMNYDGTYQEVFAVKKEIVVYQ